MWKISHFALGRVADFYYEGAINNRQKRKKDIIL